MSRIYIYGIYKDGKITYVGRTKNPKQRARQHRYTGREGVLKTLAVCNDTEAKEVERVFIAKYRAGISNKRERYYTGVLVKEVINRKHP